MKKLVLFAFAVVMIAGCSESEKKKFVVVHHNNVSDTVITHGFHYYDDGTVNMYEGGIFTKVEYVKAIE